MTRESLKQARRIVFKVGTSTLTHESGSVNLRRIDGLARVLSDIRNMGRDVVLVTSGAIGVGMGKLKISVRPHDTAGRQAVAAVGQSELMQIYSKSFAEYGHTVGQILLTRDVLDFEATRQNAENTFETLLRMGVIPIVNENDTVSTEELESGHNVAFGDNDRLSAIVAVLVRAGALVILTDTDGLYDKNPRTCADANILHEVSEITPEIVKAAGGAGSARGTGGMAAKIEAARLCLRNRVDMALVNGEDPSILYRLLDAEPVGTFFHN